MSGASWSIQYADGSGSSGTVGTDTVTIGGTTVQGQAVELATQASSQFVSGANDGLVGLSFSSINTGESYLEAVNSSTTRIPLTKLPLNSSATAAEDLLRQRPAEFGLASVRGLPPIPGHRCLRLRRD